MFSFIQFLLPTWSLCIDFAALCGKDGKMKYVTLSFLRYTHRTR
jgi:hypothetical protein